MADLIVPKMVVGEFRVTREAVPALVKLLEPVAEETLARMDWSYILQILREQPKLGEFLERGDPAGPKPTPDIPAITRKIARG